MNKIWTFVILVSISALTIFAPEEILPTLLGASSSALTLSLELMAIYAVWLGLITIVENTPLSTKISFILSPIIDKVWGKNLNHEAKKNLSLSISSSLLGIGGASVPLGIKAIENMDDKSGTVTFPMIITIIFASAGLQFLPTTIMSMMTVAGSTSPSSIVLPSFLGGLVTTVSGIGLAHILEKITHKRKGAKK